MGKKVLNPLLDVINKKMNVINPYLYNSDSIKITISATAGFVAGIKLVFASGTITIDWKDGSSPQNFVSNTELTHTYISAGTYIAEITGNILNITAFQADNCKIRSINTLKTGALTYLYLYNNLLTSIDVSYADFAANANIQLQGNTLLASFVANKTYTGSIYQLRFDGTDLTGTLDLSNLAIRQWLAVNACEKLTNIIFKNSGNAYLGNFQLDACDLGYIDFTEKGFIFSQNNAYIKLQDNNMTAEEVNHILVDLNTIATSGYTGRVINIGGTNADPDSSSGGYDGLAAKTALEGKGVTVTIT